MALVVVEWQTSEIIKYLFEDEDERHDRSFDDCLECDSVVSSSNDEFDPVLIAERLKSVADALNDDPKFKTAVKELQQAVAQEAVEQAFSRGVEVLCQTHVSQKAEVAPEMQLITASIALGLYVKKTSPDLKSKVQSALMSFLNRRVGPWIYQKGGWNKVV